MRAMRRKGKGKDWERVPYTALFDGSRVSQSSSRSFSANLCYSYVHSSISDLTPGVIAVSNSPVEPKCGSDQYSSALPMRLIGSCEELAWVTRLLVGSRTASRVSKVGHFLLSITFYMHSLPLVHSFLLSLFPLSTLATSIPFSLHTRQSSTSGVVPVGNTQNAYYYTNITLGGRQVSVMLDTGRYSYPLFPTRVQT